MKKATVDLDTGELLESSVRPRNWRERRPTDLGTEPSRTKQSFKDEVDINRIMDRFHSTGLLPPQKPQGRFGDFTGAEDYLTQATRVLEAQRAFEDLPADVRDYCENDPAELLDILNNPEREEERQELGFIDKETAEGRPSPPGTVDNKDRQSQGPRGNKEKSDATQTHGPASQPAELPKGEPNPQAKPAE